MPHRKVILSPEVWVEMAEALEQSEREHGPGQRVIFSQNVAKLWDTLETMPGIGRRRDEIANGLHSFPLESYIFYYWISPGLVEIAHMLHQRQDPTRQDWGWPDVDETGEQPRR